ncbi:hypothetical protein JTB14_038418 [Gonioctena quinquepunctata]|nr:hypothetical protein JTB14_038418 [Gonioctena quinquepunctata]
MSRSKRYYSVSERKFPSLILLLEKFRPIVEGTRFKLITDHYSLLYLNNLKDSTGRLARWSVKLRQYSFDLIHRKGFSNVVPDALSGISHSPSIDNAEILTSFSIDISLGNLDKLYVTLREEISEKPAQIPQWKI